MLRECELKSIFAASHKVWAEHCNMVSSLPDLSVFSAYRILAFHPSTACCSAVVLMIASSMGMSTPLARSKLSKKYLRPSIYLGCSLTIVMTFTGMLR